MQNENYYLYHSYDVVFEVDRKIAAKLNDFMEFVSNENAMAEARLELMTIAGIEGSGLPSGQPNGNAFNEMDLISSEDIQAFMPTAPEDFQTLMPMDSEDFKTCMPTDPSPAVASDPPAGVGLEPPGDDVDGCSPEIKRPKCTPRRKSKEAGK